jgi:hypothetical protein
MRAALPDLQNGLRPVIWFALAALATGGCAGLWDEITSRNRDLKGYFSHPDPMAVLRSSSDGAKRARALAALREPLNHGGTPEQEEEFYNILTRAALADRDPLCRLAAIRSLGHCHNPRAVKILEEAFVQQLPFPAEYNSIIRQQALTSLEDTGVSEARLLLVRVASQPEGTGAFAEKQQVLDERLTAIRGLAKFKQYDVTEALVHVLEPDKDGKLQDIALRDRANQSLHSITGKRLPPDPKIWKELLEDPNTKLASEPSLIERVAGWIDVFH